MRDQKVDEPDRERDASMLRFAHLHFSFNDTLIRQVNFLFTVAN